MDRRKKTQIAFHLLYYLTDANLLTIVNKQKTITPPILDIALERYLDVVEEVAYTWFNRLIAIRFMEVNDYLPSGVSVLSSENKDKNEPDFVTRPFETDLEFTADEQDKIIQLKDTNKLDELFRMLFIKQCNKLHDILPELFEKTDDYSELLLTISFTDKDGIVYIRRSGSRHHRPTIYYEDSSRGHGPAFCDGRCHGSECVPDRFLRVLPASGAGCGCRYDGCWFYSGFR